MYASASRARTPISPTRPIRNAGALFSWKNSPRPSASCSPASTRTAISVATASRLSATIDADPWPPDVLVPSLIGSALFQQERKRTGGNFAFQFQPSDASTFNLTGLYSKFDADNINENFMAWGQRAIGNGGTLTNTTVVDGTAVAGRVSSLNNGTADFGVVYDAIDRFAHSRVAQHRPVD